MLKRIGSTILTFTGRPRCFPAVHFVNANTSFSFFIAPKSDSFYCFKMAEFPFVINCELHKHSYRLRQAVALASDI